MVTKKQIKKKFTSSLSKDKFYAFGLELGKDNPCWTLSYISYDMHVLGAYSIFNMYIWIFGMLAW